MRLVKHAFSGHEPLEYAISSDKPSRTKQSFKDECDINVILARYQATGTLDFLNRNAPQYLANTALDFQTAMEVVASGQNAFADLPAALRDRFGNDPAAFLDFVHDESNREEAVTLGLIPKPPEASKPPEATTP